MNIMILYPFNNVSTVLGAGLLEDGNNLFFYCPTDTHIHLAYTVPYDLSIAALRTERLVQVTESLEQMKYMDIIVLPSIDVLPEKARNVFAEMCRRTFR